MHRYSKRLVILLALSLLVAPAVVTSAKDGNDDGEDVPGSSNQTGKSKDDAADKRGKSSAKDDREDDDDDGDDDDFDDEARKVHVESSGDQVALKLERKAHAAKDELKFTYDASEGVIKLAYKQKEKGARAAYEFKAHVREVIEFEDATGNGAFDPGADRVVSRRVVEELTWTVSGPTQTTLGGKPATSFVGTAALGGNGTLALRFFAVGNFTNVADLTLRPTDLKFDIEITDYPYQSEDTQLAVLVKTKESSSAKLHEHRGKGGEHSDVSLNATVDGVMLYFSWADTVTVDGETAPVKSTLVKSSDKAKTNGKRDATEATREVYLAYPRGEQIVHDPVVGVQSASSTGQERAVVPGAGFLLAIACVALVAGIVGSRRAR